MSYYVADTSRTRQCGCWLAALPPTYSYLRVNETSPVECQQKRARGWDEWRDLIRAEAHIGSYLITIMVDDDAVS